jgi:CheY-like chemotaxis protein
MELECIDFDLRICIEEVLDLFASKTAKDGIDLVYQIDSDVPALIKADSLRLKQILINLIGNSVKFTKQGEIFIGVQLKRKDDNGNIELCFKVQDTGIGIPGDKLEKLFKAFTQVDSSTTRKYGGTGLGLVICEKLVSMMGGQITVESKYEQGTTFTFTIQTTAVPGVSRTYIQHDLSDVAGKKVLVVDDNATNRKILEHQLIFWKLKPTLATSGEEALFILSETNDFDLILTDMKMSRMDGIGLAKAVKTQYPKIPVVLLSSMGDDSSKLYPALFSAVLTKPIKQSLLARQITTLLGDTAKNALQEINVSKTKLRKEFAADYPLTILIAEDNPVNQKLAERILNKLGYQPDIVSNGREALSILSAKSYDLVLMDVQMPEIDGLEATRRIRLGSEEQPVIIAMTANAMQGDREMCIDAGMNDYISKPINLDELIALLKKWTDPNQRLRKVS